MSEGAPATVRRVRWYHLPIPLAASLLVSLALAFAWGIWLTLNHAALNLQDFWFLSIVQASAGLGLLLSSLWFLSRINDPMLPNRFRRPAAREILIALGLAVAVMLAGGLFEYLCDTFLGTHLAQDAERLPITPRTLAQLPLGILVIAVLAPLSEEAFFRGLVLGWVQRHFGRWPAILGSALLFGLIHVKWWMPGGLDGWLLTGELTAMGLVLALIALRTGNLWASVAAHALNNLAAVAVIFFGL
ncbi:MAG TPA: type II CAAX endopeptidase family protein [Rhizomicrobium sp.]|jgi:hypothetical protein|nr:type II CAAX endopeptidase family protein [Rhizomicrobium sp.]